MTTRLLATLCLAAALAACGDDKGADDKGGADAGTPDAGACADFADEHTALLNAPTTAAVVRKTPAHPPVGAEGLP